MSDKAEELNLQVSKCEWIEGWVRGWTDFNVSINVRGDEVVEGHGHATTEDLAIRKACAEAIERATFDHYSDEDFHTTNGFAVHITREEAKEAALAELVERDAFLCHYLTKTPYQKVELAERLWTTSEHLLIEMRLEEMGIELCIGKMRAATDHHAFIVATFGGDSTVRPYGTIIGLGCHRDEKTAFEKALLECLSSTVAFCEKGPSPEEEISTVTSHRTLNYQKEGGSLRQLFQKMQTQECQPKSFDLSYQEFPLPDWAQGCPLFAVRAKATALQPLYFGDLTESVINWERLAEFKGEPLKFEDLPTFPHPLA